MRQSTELRCKQHAADLARAAWRRWGRRHCFLWWDRSSVPGQPSWDQLSGRQITLSGAPSRLPKPTAGPRPAGSEFKSLRERFPLRQLRAGKLGGEPLGPSVTPRLQTPQVSEQLLISTLLLNEIPHAATACCARHSVTRCMPSPGDGPGTRGSRPAFRMNLQPHGWTTVSSGHKSTLPTLLLNHQCEPNRGSSKGTPRGPTAATPPGPHATRGPGPGRRACPSLSRLPPTFPRLVCTLAGVHSHLKAHPRPWQSLPRPVGDHNAAQLCSENRQLATRPPRPEARPPRPPSWPHQGSS